MRTLPEFSHLVSELEQGRIPPDLGSDEAIDRLIVEICAAPWKTPDERGKAQWLAVRLSNLKRQPPKREEAASL
jgi:hypothetical protein